MKYEIRFTSQFKKDLKNAKKQGKNIEKLFAVVARISERLPLNDKYCDHSLHGIYKDSRECHIESDWLLIYQIFDDVFVLLLTRIGTHSDLF